MKHPSFVLLLAVSILVPLMFSACAPAGEVAEGPSEPPPPPPPMPGDFVTVPEGEFIMGSDERPDTAKNQPQLYEPEHKVTLPAFEISIFEVTNGEFARFQIESDYVAEGNWRQYYNIGKEDYPVANVTFQDAQEYCKWIGGRLPTEQEWEKAARGTDGRPYPWGDEYNALNSNTNDTGTGNTVEAGYVSADESPYGVHDLFGNVTEWTSDKLQPYPKSPARRDPNFTRGYIVVRGASYAIRGSSFKLFTRGAYLPKSQFGIGFRCVKDLPQEGGEEPPG